MGQNSEAAVLAALPKHVEIDGPAAELPSQPASWSIPRMLAVSAVISAGIWALIIGVVVTVAG